jgi:hypothetical protein
MGRLPDTLDRVSHPSQQPRGPEQAPSQIRPIEDDQRRSAQTLSRFLSTIRSHPGWGWFGLIAYAAAVTFPHENVQWAANELCIRITHAGVYRLAAEVGVAAAAVITTFLFVSLARQSQSRIVVGLWMLTLALIGGAWGTLTANNLELVHYPQYFPEGIALAALTLSPAETLAWIVVFGGLDEGYQYWVLSHGRPTVFDFNDIYMDLLGGAAGLVFAMSFLRCARNNSFRQWIGTLKRPGVMVILSLTALGVLLWALGLMLLVQDRANPQYWFDLGRLRTHMFWFRVAINGPYKYHTLAPAEGVVMIFATIALYAALTRKYALASR